MKTNKLLSSLKNITNIFSFSKQNKDYEQYFNCNNNLKGFKSNKAKKSKLDYLLNPKPHSRKRSNSTNIIIKSRFSYITELASLDNTSANLANKNSKSTQNIKEEKSNNMLFQVITPKLVDFEERKLRSKRIMKKFILKKGNNENETTLDPGKYNPRYDCIRKKFPVAFFGKPRNYNNITLKNKIKNKSINNIKETKINNLKIQIKNLENKKSKSLNYLKKYKNIENTPKISRNNPIINYNNIFINKSESFKNKNWGKNKIREKLINNKESTLLNINSKDSLPSPVIKDKNNKENEVKENNETEKNNDRKEFDDFLKMELESHKMFYEGQTKIRCPVSFEKMPGRKTIVNKPISEVTYTPNYNSIRPHIPSTIFRYRKTFQNLKKYITGKIIRSYCYTPDSYFILQINKKNRKDEL